MGLYLENGYVNIENITNRGSVFNLICGGRGTGKTYGVLKYVKEHNIKFMFLRRTISAVKRIATPQFMPFKPLNIDCFQNNPVDISPLPENTYVFNDAEGNELGYLMALPTIATIRGFDASDVDLIFYDEFIREKHERAMKDEFSALMNAYETINRNRELTGNAPVKMIMCSNSETLMNPIFMGFNIIANYDTLMKSEQEVMTLRERGITMVHLKKSPISELKKHTALYKATAGTRFADMAITNDFAITPDTSRKVENITEFYLVAIWGILGIYHHKSAERYYISTKISGSAPVYGLDEISKRRFKRDFSALWGRYVQGLVTFENLNCESLLTNYYGESIM